MEWMIIIALTCLISGLFLENHFLKSDLHLKKIQLKELWGSYKKLNALYCDYDTNAKKDLALIRGYLGIDYE